MDVEEELKNLKLSATNYAKILGIFVKNPGLSKLVMQNPKIIEYLLKYPKLAGKIMKNPKVIDILLKQPKMIEKILKFM